MWFLHTHVYKKVTIDNLFVTKYYKHCMWRVQTYTWITLFSFDEVSGWNLKEKVKIPPSPLSHLLKLSRSQDSALVLPLLYTMVIDEVMQIMLHFSVNKVCVKCLKFLLKISNFNVYHVLVSLHPVWPAACTLHISLNFQVYQLIPNNQTNQWPHSSKVWHLSIRLPIR